MPLSFTFIGLVLVITGFQNSYKQLGTLLQGDLTGPGNFTYWIIAIGAVGALGYIKPLEGFSKGFMALILLMIVLAHSKNGQNLIASFTNQLNSASTSGNGTIGEPLANSSAGGSSNTSQSSGIGLGDVGSIISAGSTIASIAAL